MEDYPRTILEFEERFATEEACCQYLAQLRWPCGFCCPRCGYTRAWSTKRGLYRCCQCDFQVSVTAGTIFQDTRKHISIQPKDIAIAGQALLPFGSAGLSCSTRDRKRHPRSPPLSSRPQDTASTGVKRLTLLTYIKLWIGRDIGDGMY